MSAAAEARCLALAVKLLKHLALRCDDVPEMFFVLETMLTGVFLLADASPEAVTEYMDALTVRTMERHAAGVLAAQADRQSAGGRP
jgi:hypothetical protein